MDERALSPLTGWTRRDWAALADRLLLAARRHGSPGHGRITMPGGPGGLGHDVDGLEGWARSALLAGVRLAGEAGSDPLGLAPWYARGVATGVDPAAPDRWVRPGEHPQAVVEACSVALFLHLTREWVWEELDDRVRARVVDWLGEVRSATIPDNNWVWFRIIVETFLREVGAPWSPELVADHLERHESWYRGAGWFSDGPRRNYDHYVGWAMQTLPAVWTLMAPDWGLTTEVAATHGPRLARYLEDAQYLVGADGGPLVQGRSLIYRWCTLAPLWAGELMGVSPLPPGLTRRICSGTVSHFVNHGAVRDDVLTMGWFGPFPAMAQGYSGVGSPYWAAKGMLGLWLPGEHRVWTAVEEPMPVERGDTHRVITAPGWLVSGTRSDGVVRVLNLGTDAAYEGEEIGEGPLYSSLAFSTRTAPPMAGSWAMTPAANSLVLTDEDARPSARSGMVVDTLDEVDGILVGRCHWRAHWVEDGLDDRVGHGVRGPVREGPWLDLAVVCREGVEVRVAWVHPAGPGADGGQSPGGSPGFPDRDGGAVRCLTGNGPTTEDEPVGAEWPPNALVLSGWPVGPHDPSRLGPVWGWQTRYRRVSPDQVEPLHRRTRVERLVSDRSAGPHVALVGLGSTGPDPVVEVDGWQVSVRFPGREPVVLEPGFRAWGNRPG